MVLAPQWLRPGVGRSLGNHEARIRALERRAAGSGWRFDTDNEGGWGYLQFNDCFDLDLLPDPLAVGGTWGAAFEDDSGCGFVIGSTTTLLLKSRDILSVESIGNWVATIGGDISFTVFGSIFLNLPAAPGPTGSLWNDSGTVKVA